MLRELVAELKHHVLFKEIQDAARFGVLLVGVCVDR